MTRPAGARLVGVALAAATACSVSASAAAAESGPAPEQLVRMGYVEMKDDLRYSDAGAYAGIVYRTFGRPWPGARVGVADARTLGRVTGIGFTLERTQLSSSEAVADLEQWARTRELHFIIADLPAPVLLGLADAVRDLPALVFNVSAQDDVLRGTECRDNIAHIAPSQSMLSDALVQYLVAKDWRDILVLQGPSNADARTVAALRRSATKFGAKVADRRPFEISKDPRRREYNNVALMSAASEADVAFVADSSGEFARYVPYSTAEPMPVVGAAGLVPTAWHWTWFRHGAAQLQHRFERLVSPRRMNGGAWAAWVAVKAVTQAALRVGTTDPARMRSFLLGSEINLDGAKGYPMSFRSWDRQLRQPILLATADATIARAPLPEFLHRTNALDTLGVDSSESLCRFSSRS